MAGDDEDWKQFGVFSHLDLSYSNISKNSLENLLREKGREIQYLDLSACINVGDGNL